jgi:drug/metabolite transporter (DMT)-like permease
MRSRSPKGVRTASNAIDPTTTRLMAGEAYMREYLPAVAAFALAFVSSVAWGTGDFLGGLKSRQLPLLNVLVASQLTGLLLIAGFVAIRGSGPPDADFAVFGALAAVAGVIGLACFYRGLAVGNMGVVAPISASAAVVPVVIGVATGDRPSALQAAGLALALAGVVVASREEVGGGRLGRRTARGAGLAIVSALGFGFFFVGMDRAADSDVAWAMLANRITGVCLLVAAVAVARPPFRIRRHDVPVLFAVGAFDIAANATFAVAATKGLVSLVSVLGSLYPLTTVALAAIVLGERPHRLAGVGIATALIGVVLIAAG